MVYFQPLKRNQEREFMFVSLKSVPLHLEGRITEKGQKPILSGIASLIISERGTGSTFRKHLCVHRES